jgi:hypothetical protein
VPTPSSATKATTEQQPHRRELRNRKILSVISREGSPNVQGLGKLRCVVEQTVALLQRFKRIVIR